MRRSVTFHPAAVQDAEEAVAWYAQRSPRSADRFLSELDHLIDLVADVPGQFQPFELGLRRAVFRDSLTTLCFGPTTAALKLLRLHTARGDLHFGVPGFLE